MPQPCPTIDPEQQWRAFYRFLAHETETIHGLGHAHSHFVRSEDEFVQIVQDHVGPHNVYAGIHERRPGGRKKADVRRITVVPLDFDLVQLAGSEKAGATPESREAVLRVAKRYREWAEAGGFGRSSSSAAVTGCMPTPPSHPSTWTAVGSAHWFNAG